MEGALAPSIMTFAEQVVWIVIALTVMTYVARVVGWIGGRVGERWNESDLRRRLRERSRERLERGSRTALGRWFEEHLPPEKRDDLWWYVGLPLFGLFIVLLNVLYSFNLLSLIPAHLTT